VSTEKTKKKKRIAEKGTLPDPDPNIMGKKGKEVGMISMYSGGWYQGDRGAVLSMGTEGGQLKGLENP